MLAMMLGNFANQLLVPLENSPENGSFYYMQDWQAMILFLVLMVILVYALIRNAAVYEVPVHASHGDGREHTAVEHASAPFVSPDDLTIVEGIGPKTQAVFRSAGITTLQDLASSDVEVLQEILDAAGLRLGDPGTWPEQAKLAAEGKMDALDQLQRRLKGGRAI